MYYRFRLLVYYLLTGFDILPSASASLAPVLQVRASTCGAEKTYTKSEITLRLIAKVWSRKLSL